jgi:IclR family acetate operon transcriptional repressor
MSRSPAYRIFERLAQLEFLRSTGNGRWRLGPVAARLATVQSTDVVDIAPELLRALAQQTRETLGVAALKW